MTDLSPLVNSMNRVNSTLNALTNQVSSVDQRVGQVASDLATTTSELRELKQQFEEFVLVAERTANVQRSETKLGALKDDLEREYGHYAVVRRSSIGTLQAFDIGNVTNKTVQQVSEELMIQTPRYWLAPALVALAAWSRDDENLATKSVDAAFTRDPAKTSLFFALVLRRQRRLEAASRWLRHFFTSLDPRALSRDFAVVLEGAAQDAFGTEGRDLVLQHLEEWSRLLRDQPEIVEAQITSWTTEISVQRRVVDNGLYPRLVETCPQWPEFKDSMEHASAHGAVVEKYRAILETAPVISTVLEEQMDELLEQLVTEYDHEELPLRREIVYHEAVLDSNGDLTRAREASDSMVQALDETLDALSLATNAALHPKLLGVSTNTQKLAIGAGKDDFRTAVGRYAVDYRSKVPPLLEVVLGPSHSGYASALGFGTWRTPITTPEKDAQASLSTEWDRVLAEYVDRHRLKQSAFIIGGAVTIGAALFGLLFGPIGLLVCFLIAGGISALVIWFKKRKADAAVAKAEAERDQAKAVSLDIYREATAEYVDAHLVYTDEDARESELLALVDSWPSFVPKVSA
jgi:hypothetical protein